MCNYQVLPDDLVTLVTEIDNSNSTIMRPTTTADQKVTTRGVLEHKKEESNQASSVSQSVSGALEDQNNTCPSNSVISSEVPECQVIVTD